MLVVVGLSHRTAPIDIREQLALPKAELPALLEQMCREDAVSEALVLSTCNRVEVVACGSPGADLEATSRAAEGVLVGRAPQVSGHLYGHHGGEALRHLFRVASSLDSLVVGEPQILGQLKGAFELARQTGTVGTVLNQALPRALRTAKRVRSETTIGAGQVSVPSVAIDLAGQIFGDLAGRHATLVGSGEMAETVARLLARAGAEISVVGRNQERVETLCRSLGARARSMAELDDALVEADVVVTSTSAPGHVIEAERVAGLRRKRRGRTLFFIDLAVPRDVDPRTEDIDGVFVYNVDDFSQIVAGTLAGRAREAARAEEIIEREIQGYDRWAEAAQVTPLIVRLRRHFSQVLASELERSLRGKLKHLTDSDREALQRMQEATLKKLLHQPTAQLRAAAAEPDSGAAVSLDQLAQALDHLFPVASEAEEADKRASRPPQPDQGEDAQRAGG